MAVRTMSNLLMPSGDNSFPPLSSSSSHSPASLAFSLPPLPAPMLQKTGAPFFQFLGRSAPAVWDATTSSSSGQMAIKEVPPNLRSEHMLQIVLSAEAIVRQSKTLQTMFRSPDLSVDIGGLQSEVENLVWWQQKLRAHVEVIYSSTRSQADLSSANGSSNSVNNIIWADHKAASDAPHSVLPFLKLPEPPKISTSNSNNNGNQHNNNSSTTPTSSNNHHHNNNNNNNSSNANTYTETTIKTNPGSPPHPSNNGAFVVVSPLSPSTLPSSSPLVSLPLLQPNLNSNNLAPSSMSPLSIINYRHLDQNRWPGNPNTSQMDSTPRKTQPALIMPKVEASSEDDSPDSYSEGVLEWNASDNSFSHRPHKRAYKKKPQAYIGKRCHSCNTNTTPEWRKGPTGPKSLCNACGLQFAKSRRMQLSAPSSPSPSDGAASLMLMASVAQQSHGRTSPY